MDPISRLHTQNSINLEFSCYKPENYYSGILDITEDGLLNQILRSRIQYGFWSDNLENYYSSVWGIATNLIKNRNSAIIGNLLLRSHTWFFYGIHIIPYSFVWKIHKGFFTSFLSNLFFFTIRVEIYCYILFRWYLFFLTTYIIFE